MDQSRYIEQKRLQTIVRDRMDASRPPNRQSGMYTRFKQFFTQESRPPYSYTPLLPRVHKIQWGGRFPPAYGLLRGYVGPNGPTPHESPMGPLGPRGWDIRGPRGPRGPKETTLWRMTQSDIYTFHKLAILPLTGVPFPLSDVYINGNVGTRHVHGGALCFPYQEMESRPVVDLNYETGIHYKINMQSTTTNPFQIRLFHIPPGRLFSIQLLLDYSQAGANRWICQSVDIGERVYSIMHAGGYPVLDPLIQTYTQSIVGIQVSDGSWKITSVGRTQP
jgi:hypothetical protein